MYCSFESVFVKWSCYSSFSGSSSSCCCPSPSSPPCSSSPPPPAPWPSPSASWPPDGCTRSSPAPPCVTVHVVLSPSSFSSWTLNPCWLRTSKTCWGVAWQRTPSAWSDKLSFVRDSCKMRIYRTDRRWEEHRRRDFERFHWNSPRCDSCDAGKCEQL